MNQINSLRPIHLRILFPELLTLPKTDPRRLGAPKAITHSRAIDLELYTYFALILRDFIHPWYRFITTDEELTAEILEILTLLVQKLEKRLCEEVDWTELILLDVPKLLSIHYYDYRKAKKRLYMNHGGGCDSISELFHGMQPHFALQPIKNREKEYLSALAESILKILLRPQDYNSECVRHLIREIISNLVLYNLIESLADPYIIHTIICKLLSSYESLLDELEISGQFAETYFSAFTNGQTLAVKEEIKNSNQYFDQADSKHEIKGINGESLTKQMQRLQEEQRKNEPKNSNLDEDMLEEEIKNQQESRKQFSFGYITLQVLLTPIRTFWYRLVSTMMQSQERYHQVNQHKKRTRQIRLIEPLMGFLFIAFSINRRPVIRWAWQMLAMFFWPLIRVFGGGLLIDKFLEQTVLHVLSEDHVVFYLRLGCDLLWPDGVFIQRADPPSPLQREQMRVRAERLLTISIPDNIRNVLFETKDLNELQTHIHDTLEPLQNKQINKHLLYLLIDLILSKILPELTV
ncbi:PXA domain-containing protein [Cokeromyces recurvatus]|uniref:PXA domain-containing protein n=1 Tax=Cokeromyces recurvatus TaxID=90255 RepID=UPI002220D760|nr:PXA domain-containing protein [Cokeromyces recurvatus]KAI7905202.1 PXA domain-containing protein [Cokeromyces recurvatus]